MNAPTPRSATSLFLPGANCYSVARASRVGLLIDGEDYFRAFAHTAERAQRSIVILAWDFSSRARLHFDEPTERHAPPAQLGDFLNWLVKRRRHLHIYVLDWDYPMVFGTDREFPPIYGLGWKPHRRVHVAYDNTHPLSGSHHQKIVVVDDTIAFVGGFDLTDRRWDTPSHCVDDWRRKAGNTPYPPFHDLMMVVEGEPARSLASIARMRWRAATGHMLPPVKGSFDPWPPNLRADFTGVDVAVARTFPPTAECGAVHEVEQLYLDMIFAARKNIYIENQYFTAYRLGEALIERLAEPDGPEIVVVVRYASHGWLEERTMHVLRTRLIHRLREADVHGHFQVYYAHIDGLPDGTCIDVHSKLMIVDDEILRIGSANFCNRSMGMDSECDAAIEARGEPQVAAVIRDFRNRLLAEHLDKTPALVEEAMQREGSLRRAIDSLAGGPRTLKALEDVPEWSDTALLLAKVADPERPVSLDQLVPEFSHQGPRKGPAWGRLLLIVLIFVGLAASWRYTPLAEVISAEDVTRWAREFATAPWAPLVILVAYTPACFVMFPRPLITLGAVIAFGPVMGFTYGMSGILIASAVTYFIGRALPRNTVRALAGDKVNDITEALRRRGLIAVTAARLVPLAPFAVLGFVAGASHIALWHFMLGTFLGMLPGALATTIFGGQLEAALSGSSEMNFGLIAVAVAFVVAITMMVKRWLVKQGQQIRHDGARN